MSDPKRYAERTLGTPKIVLNFYQVETSSIFVKGLLCIVPPDGSHITKLLASAWNYCRNIFQFREKQA